MGSAVFSSNGSNQTSNSFPNGSNSGAVVSVVQPSKPLIFGSHSVGLSAGSNIPVYSPHGPSPSVNSSCIYPSMSAALGLQSTAPAPITSQFSGGAPYSVQNLPTTAGHGGARRRTNPTQTSGKSSNHLGAGTGVSSGQPGVGGGMPGHLGAGVSATPGNLGAGVGVTSRHLGAGGGTT